MAETLEGDWHPGDELSRGGIENVADDGTHDATSEEKVLRGQ